MQLIETLYVVFSITLSAAGLSMVGLSVRAYQQTSRQSMFHLSIGFTLIVGAAIATTVSAFLTQFENSRMLLTVEYAFFTVGFLFVIYSITFAE